MSSKHILSAFLFVMLVLSSSILWAQQPQPADTPPTANSPEQAEKEAERKKAIETKALAMLDDTVTSALGLKLAENRAIALSTAADLLWPRDEKRARSLFRDAINNVVEAIADSDKKANSESQMFNPFQVRRAVIQTIARRDPQLALDLMRSSRPATNSEIYSYYQRPEEELSLEQAIASQVLASDPKKAFQMAEESLSKGVSYELIGILQRLQQRDADAAKTLAADMVKKLQSTNFAASRGTGWIAVELLRMTIQPRGGDSFIRAANPGNVKPPAPLPMEQQTQRDLIDAIISAANSSPQDNLLMNIQPLMPEIEKIVPDRALQLNRRIEAFNKMQDPQFRKMMQFQSAMENGKAEEILEAAQKAPPEMKKPLYFQAAMKYLSDGDDAHARQVINDNIQNSGEREMMLAQIDSTIIMRNLAQGKIEEAHKIASAIRSKPLRASTLAQLALFAARKDNKKQAQQLLEEAQALVDEDSQKPEQVNARLLIARAYVLVEPQRAFDIVENMIEQANEMLSAAATLDKFGMGQGLFRKGELILTPGFVQSNEMLSQYGKELSELARFDFERARSVTDKLHRNEVRIMAHLLLAQGVLSDRIGKENSPDMNYGMQMNYSIGSGIILY